MSHRVFLSSTFTDLVEHRKAVQAAIRQLGAIDVSMENFGAREERPADECIRLVQQESDVFVGIYAHRYGYVPDGAELSISEMEYKAASEVSLPRFIYILDENHPWRPGYIDMGESRARLVAFKGELQKRHICQFFDTHDHLAAKVTADVGRHIALQTTLRVGATSPAPSISFESLQFASIETPEQWSEQRNALYAEHRGVFLTHIIKPSSIPGQVFDVFIYLIRHKTEDLSGVRIAEFFLGSYWGNKVFPAVEQNGFIGMSTSALGAFLCICRVTFKDGTYVDLERYIDFEMQRTGGASVYNV